MEESEIVRDKNIEKAKLNEKMLKIVGVVVMVFTVVILVAIKMRNEAFPLLTIFIIGFVGIGAGLLMFFGFWIYDRLSNEKEKSSKDENEVPAPISIAEARKIAQELILNADYADMAPHCLGERTYTVGKLRKSKIYVYMARGVYEKDTYHIVINLNYPNLYSILISSNLKNLRDTVNSLAIEPEDLPEVEIIEEKNPILGTERKVTKTSSSKDNVKKKEKKEEDLE